MTRLASCGLVLGLAVLAAGCGSSNTRAVPVTSVHSAAVARTVPSGNSVSRGPFAPSGAWAGGGGSGLWGDGSSGRNGTGLGCIDGRRYSDAFGIKNTSKEPVTLLSARGANPVARIVDLVAIQLRLSPPLPKQKPHLDNGFGPPIDLVYTHWSAKPTQPVTIPPGRTATVQTNFLMRGCKSLAHGQTLSIPGTLALRYRTAGRARVQRLDMAENKLVVGRGPTIRTCAPVAGSARLVSSNMSCALARQSAPQCRKMHNEGWLDCQLGGTLWVCGRFAGPGYPLFERCYLPQEKARGFGVVWAARGLALWGAVQNRPANAGWRILDRYRTTGGRCALRDGGRTLEYESDALTLGSSRMITGMPMAAHVRFLIHGYHGPGSYWAQNILRVLAPRAAYPATVGRILITSASKHALTGMAYARLRVHRGAAGVNLNGTWSCRTGG